MTPGGHATELRLVGDLQSSPTGGVHCGVDVGAKSAGEGWASEQEGAAAGIRARENRCEKSLRAAARGKRCMSPCPALVAMRERERETNRQRSWLCSTAPSASTVTSPSRRGGGNGLQLCFARQVPWPGKSIGQAALSCPTAILRPPAGTGEAMIEIASLHVLRTGDGQVYRTP
jgi:hypothetical protein